MKQLLSSRGVDIFQRDFQQVVIRGDGQVKYEKVMTVMAELQMAGASDIGLISKPISSNK